MNIFLRSMLIVSSLVVFSTAAYAAKTAEHDAPMMHDGKMQNGMAHDMTSKDMQHAAKHDDKAFLSAMIPHHEAAVVMAKDVLAKGKDAQVKKWAHEVITGQQAEIAEMSGWLKSMGGADKSAAKAMHDSMHTMMTTPMDKDADRNFVVMMIDHHASALVMATKALIHSADDKIVSLSKQIITSQAKEIMAYKLWVKKYMQ